jgi:hypothetical protein
MSLYYPPNQPHMLDISERAIIALPATVKGFGRAIEAPVADEAGG